MGIRAGLVAVALLGAGVPSTGAQEAERFYVGAGLAVLELRSEYEGIPYGDTPLAARVYGGIQLRERTALELALTGAAELRSGEILGSGIQRLDITSDYRAAAIRGMFSLPLRELAPRWRRLTVFGTAGGFVSREQRHVVELVSGAIRDDFVDDSGLTLGGGIIYEFPRVNVRASMERYSNQSAVEVAAELRF